MTSTTTKKTKTTYSDTDWAEYQKGRPSYPTSLTEIIYRYHRRKPQAKWERLVDIGAGSGIASTNFMPEFKIVHISDPSPSNEEQARDFLSKWAEQHNLNPIFEFSQSTGEEAHTKTGEADLVICATAAHWMDPDALSRSMAKILRPGGTLAVFSYWMPTFPHQSQEFHDAFAKTLDSLVMKPIASGNDHGRTILTKVLERRMTGKGALDSFPLFEDVYDDPQRVHINAGKDVAYRALSRQFGLDGRELDGLSRVSSRDEIIRYQSDVDAEAEGWSFQADKKWIASFLESVRPTNNKLPEEQSRVVYEEWERAFDKECPEGKVRVFFPVYVALATRGHAVG